MYFFDNIGPSSVYLSFLHLLNINIPNVQPLASNVHVQISFTAINKFIVLTAIQNYIKIIYLLLYNIVFCFYFGLAHCIWSTQLFMTCEMIVIVLALLLPAFWMLAPFHPLSNTSDIYLKYCSFAWWFLSLKVKPNWLALYISTYCFIFFIK